jgi:hypothetical protein
LDQVGLIPGQFTGENIRFSGLPLVTPRRHTAEMHRYRCSGVSSLDSAMREYAAKICSCCKNMGCFRPETHIVW